VAATPNVQLGSPSWTHIEPCASLHSRNFGSYSSKPEACRLRHRAIGKAALPGDDRRLSAHDPVGFSLLLGGVLAVACAHSARFDRRGGHGDFPPSSRRGLYVPDGVPVRPR
jgi:hypothetical protein